ncbi:hypothetical protein [Companilactobacillus sp. DQM5]|uniref:hypothetical protein n=1 Tax=Companilactobacillus sp. DQM5 TaxID=3463359 RepID=UPI0040587D7E
MKEKSDDLELVNLVKYQNSSEALKKLFNKFLPITEGIISMYYIRNFDRNDWIQEAYIVCHETCFRFNGEQGSKFGNFYKMRLANHAKSLLRRELALKRKINKEASSFETSIIEDSFEGGFVGANHTVIYNHEIFDLDDFMGGLTKIETEVFKMLLGYKKANEIKANKRQIQLAQTNCKKKLLDYFK